MASQETFHTVLELLPKAGALLLPLVYKLWTQSRKTPVIAVLPAEGGGVKLTTVLPVRRFAIQITAKGTERPLPPFVGAFPVYPDFSGWKFEDRVNPARLRRKRFTRHDPFEIHPTEGAALVSLEVIDSDSVLTQKTPSKYLWVYDYTFLVASVLVLGYFALGPVESYLEESSNQTQDSVNHAIGDVFLKIAEGMTLSAILLLIGIFASPTRRAQVFRMRRLTLGSK